MDAQSKAIQISGDDRPDRKVERPATADSPRPDARPATSSAPRADPPADAPRGEGHRKLARLADEVLPALIARFAASDLGEIEVREGGWRVRLRRDPSVAATDAPAGSASPAVHLGSTHDASHGTVPGSHVGAPAGVIAARGIPTRVVVTSPAVGFYVPREGLAVGQAVRAGDVVGHVNVLGVGQEVVVPVDGIVGRLLASAGEAVEYGQELLRVDPVEIGSALGSEGREAPDTGVHAVPDQVAAEAELAEVRATD